MTLSNVFPINTILSVLIFTALSIGSSNSYANDQNHYRSDKHYDKHSDEHKSHEKHKQRKRRTNHVHNDNCHHEAPRYTRNTPRLIASIGNIVQFSLGGPKPHYHHVHGRRVQCYDRHSDNNHSRSHSGYGSYGHNSDYDRYSNNDRHSDYDRYSNYDRRSRERVNYDHHHKPYGCAHQSHRARNDHRYSNKHRYEDKYARRSSHIKQVLKHLIKAHFHGARECYTRH